MTYISDPRPASAFRTVGEMMQADAVAAGIPPRTLEQIQTAIAKCRKQKSDKSMARLLLNHGRMTDEARAWLSTEYPQG